MLADSGKESEVEVEVDVKVGGRWTPVGNSQGPRSPSRPAWATTTAPQKKFSDASERLPTILHWHHSVTVGNAQMNSQDRTIVVVDDDMDFSAEDFVLTWNAESSQEDLPVASLLKKEQTFNMDFWAIVGDVASVIGIVSFIGVPTVAAIVRKILEKFKPSQQEGQELRKFEIDETIIDLGHNGKVKRITIRRAAG
jgi:hypothetical protein